MAPQRWQEHTKLNEISRKEALSAEDAYMERVHANVIDTENIFSPLDNKTYDATSKNRGRRDLDQRSSAVKKLIQKWANQDLMEIYAQMPKNRLVLHDIWHKELFGPRTVRVTIAGTSWNPIKDLIQEGKSYRQGSAGDIHGIKELIARRPDVFYYIGMFSPTGWEEECRQHLQGENYLIALSDNVQDGWRTWFAQDPRWQSGTQFFDLTSDEEKIDAIQLFVKRNTGRILMDELTEDLLLDRLGYPVPIVREALENIAIEDPFLKFDTKTRPYRLVRIYR